MATYGLLYQSPISGLLELFSPGGLIDLRDYAIPNAG
jgi:hypothetical protein